MSGEAGLFKIDLIAGARPNFMKIAPLYHALKKESWCQVRLIHTGQHFDSNMSDAFFKDLELPDADVHFGVGGGSHAQQTSRVMCAYEETCLRARPDLSIVVGDIDSTLACTLAAKKLGIEVAHLESGLRSRDRAMPEELNRLATDVLADYLWTPSPDADANLRAEGIASSRIVRVGNIMIDSYEMMRAKIKAETTTRELGLGPGTFAVVTLHRPSNVDHREALESLSGKLQETAAELPVVFPVHPRTRKNLETFGLLGRLERAPGIQLTAPLGYKSFMKLVEDCKLVITDSGGVQEESTYLGIPCLTLRDSTERPITLTEGTNTLVDGQSLIKQVKSILSGEYERRGKRPERWDGQTASRVVAHLREISQRRRIKQLNPGP
jgi:UDP-N-acetylglucosamine 2-epimerase (non-hydrolysing)